MHDCFPISLLDTAEGICSLIISVKSNVSASNTWMDISDYDDTVKVFWHRQCFWRFSPALDSERQQITPPPSSALFYVWSKCEGFSLQIKNKDQANLSLVMRRERFCRCHGAGSFTSAVGFWATAATEAEIYHDGNLLDLCAVSPF